MKTENPKRETRNLPAGRQRSQAQRTGCLPAGCDGNSWLTVGQFCRWKRRSRFWFSRQGRSIPGVQRSSPRDVRIHVGAHLRGVFPGLAKHF